MLGLALLAGLVLAAGGAGARPGPAPASGGAGWTPAAAADRVAALPGLGRPEAAGVGNGLFGGYLTVDAKAGRALYYTLALAEGDDWRGKPLVLWLNGGPGCSSLGGFLSELGPFFPTPGGAGLEANPHGWHKHANMVFLESPAFVGFSYSNTTADRSVGDARTAKDARRAMLELLKRFPELGGSPFYISGESYGGHYVPSLAAAIVEGNAGPEWINLKGFLVGNAWTAPKLDNEGAADYWASHGLVSGATVAQMKKDCDFNIIGPLRAGDGECDALVASAMDEMGDINIYQVYADVCHAAAETQVAQLAKHAFMLGAARPKPAEKYAPCVENWMEEYLNRTDVKAALHARTDIAWSQCSDFLEYSRASLLTDYRPIYRKLLEQSDLRMLVYSGDVDGIVPITGTLSWIASMDLPVSKPWAPWTTARGQVGGYRVEYGSRFAFQSVRGAGHMVPYTQPLRAEEMFAAFLAEDAGET